MSASLEGRCQCGDLRYRVSGTLMTVFACHCLECQRQSSSAFGMALWVKDATVDLLCGELKNWIRELPSGRSMRCSFCPNCGTRLFHQVLGQLEVISIKPGTLDDTSWIKPAGHIWTKRMQSWVQLDPDGLQYDGNPESFSDLVAAWMESSHQSEA